MELKRVQRNELNEISIWLEKMNSQPMHNIGYCGTEAEEILMQLEFDLLHGEETSIVVAKEEGKIVALMGLDIDEESAEVWGPFSTKADFEYELQLLKKLKQLYPEVTELAFYINKENKKQIQWMEKLQAKKQGKHYFLIANKNNFNKTVSVKTVAYGEQYAEQLTTLHDGAFPETYYDATTIIRRATHMDHCYLLLVVEQEKVAGYCYFEIDPYINEASVNYIMIDESQRGKGLGNKLLQEVLATIFSTGDIEEVTLSVNAENEQAYKMFIHAGFEKRNELIYYVLG